MMSQSYYKGILEVYFVTELLQFRKKLLFCHVAVETTIIKMR